MKLSEYVAPEMEVVELSFEGGFCSSGEPGNESLGENQGSWD